MVLTMTMMMMMLGRRRHVSILAKRGAQFTTTFTCNKCKVTRIKALKTKTDRGEHNNVDKLLDDNNEDNGNDDDDEDNAMSFVLALFACFRYSFWF